MNVDASVIPREAPTESRKLRIERLINAGWTGRDQAAVDAHIAELEAEGVDPPGRTPILYPKPSHAITTAETIQVAGSETSGEIEVALYLADDAVYVTAGSDHTDRELERSDVALSKMVCPNVVGTTFWRLEDIIDHWDSLEIRSWSGPNQETMTRYQMATLEEIIRPEALIELVSERTDDPQEGTLLFSGSVATDDGELRIEPYFAGQLHDPVLDRTIQFSYTTTVIDWHSP